MQNGYRDLTEQDLSTIYTTTSPATNGPYAADAGLVMLGARGITGDARTFVYANIGGTGTVAPGTLMVQAAAPSNSTGLAINTTTATTGANTTAQLTLGSVTLWLTAAGTAFTQDQFAGGYMEVLQTSGSNNGPISYRIVGNTAPATTTGVFMVQLAQTDALLNASVLVPGTDTVNLVYNPWWAVTTSTTSAFPAGLLRQQSVGASGQYNFAWLQVTGPALLQLDATSGGVTASGLLYQSTTTAGDVAPAAPTLSHGTASAIAKARFTATASSTVSAFLTVT